MTDTSNRRQQADEKAAAGILAAASVGYFTRSYAQLTKSQAVHAVTPEAWLVCADPLAMLCFLHGRGSGRKFRLFAIACARDEFAHGAIPENECPPGSLPQYHAAIEAAEAYADGGQPLAMEYLLHWVAYPSPGVATDEEIAHAALGFDPDVGLWIRPPEETVPRIIGRYRTHPSHYLRDIFGSVFHQADLSPALLTWHDGAVGRLAQTAYDERTLPVGTLDAACLAVLADMLEEAGCTDETMLGHLRSPGPHVRGCWAVDCILGKA